MQLVINYYEYIELANKLCYLGENLICETLALVNLILSRNVCQMNKWLCIHRELIIINLSVEKQTSITSGTDTGQKLTRSYVDVHFNECTFQAHTLRARRVMVALVTVDSAVMICGRLIFGQSTETCT